MPTKYLLIRSLFCVRIERRNMFKIRVLYTTNNSISVRAFSWALRILFLTNLLILPVSSSRWKLQVVRAIFAWRAYKLSTLLTKFWICSYSVDNFDFLALSARMNSLKSSFFLFEFVSSFWSLFCFFSSFVSKLHILSSFLSKIFRFLSKSSSK